MFAFVDKATLTDKIADSQKVVNNIDSLNDYKSIEQIIVEEQLQGFKEKKNIYKLPPEAAHNRNESEQDRFERTKFLKVRIKKQTYQGKATLAIYLNSYTKKVQEHLLRMKQLESH